MQSSDSFRLDPIGPAREVCMDLLGGTFGEKALRDPDFRLPRDRGGAEHRSRAFRVVDVVRLEEEGAAPDGRLHELRLREDAGQDSAVLFGASERARVVLHDLLSAEMTAIRHRRELLERLRGRVLRVEDRRTSAIASHRHRVREDVVRSAPDVCIDGEMGTADLADRDRVAVRDVAARKIDPSLQDVRRRGQVEGLAQRDEVHGVRAQGDEHLHPGGLPDLAGEPEGAGVRGLVILRSPNRDVVVRGMGEHESGATRLLEHLGGPDAEPRPPQVEVVIEDCHRTPAIAHGNPGLFVSLEQEASDIVRKMAELGMPPLPEDRLYVMDATHLRLAFREKEKGKDWIKILSDLFEEAVHAGGYKLFALDSLDVLYAIVAFKEVRRELFHFVGVLKELGFTGFLVAETPLGVPVREGRPEDFLADGIILLEQFPVGAMGVQLRVRGVKMRGARIDRGYFLMDWDGGEVLATKAIQQEP